MNLYNEILKRFTGDDFREWMQKPFLIGDHAYATDAHVMVIVPKDRVTGINELERGDPEFVLKVIPAERNMNSDVPVEVLKAAIEKAPLVDEMKETKTECKECDGAGEVEWDYGKWTKEFDCPVCYGEGSTYTKIPSGNKILSNDGYMKIGNSYFRVKMISDIVKVAELLEESEIRFIYQKESNNANMIQIKDVEMLLSRCYAAAIEEGVKEGEDTLVTTINL